MVLFISIITIFFDNHMQFENMKSSTVGHITVWVCDVIYVTMGSFFGELISLCHNDATRQMPENQHTSIATFRTHTTCDISANHFNHHFANIGNDKIIGEFQNSDHNLSRKEIIFIRFVSWGCLIKILKNIWSQGLNLTSPVIIYWVWSYEDLVLL